MRARMSVIVDSMREAEMLLRTVCIVDRARVVEKDANELLDPLRINRGEGFRGD